MLYCLIFLIVNKCQISTLFPVITKKKGENKGLNTIFVSALSGTRKCVKRKWLKNAF